MLQEFPADKHGKNTEIYWVGSAGIFFLFCSGGSLSCRFAGRNVNRNRITRCRCTPEVRYLVGFYVAPLELSGKYNSDFLLTYSPSGANIHFYPFPICLLVRKPAPEEQHVNRKSQIQYLARSGGALLICFPTSPQSILKSGL